MSFAKLQQRLVDTYETIHEHAPIARIFVIGCPNPLPAALPPACKTLSLPSPPYIGLPASDVPWLDGLNAKLNKAIRAAAVESRVATYLDPIGFKGHDVCGADPWFYPLDWPTQKPQTLHPNLKGQQYLAKLLHSAAGAPPG